MQKILFTILLFFGIAAALPTAVHGNGESSSPLVMEELTVQILPEYTYHPKDGEKDHPPLLVGYQGTLRNVTNEPLRGKIEIPLPMDEKNFKIGFVGDYSADLRELYNVEYEIDKEKGVISWAATEEIAPEETYKFVVEYYTDEISESKSGKTIDYQFKSYTDIGMFNLIFVEPMNTDRFQLDPSPDSHQKNSYGMNMFIYTINGMKAGDEQAVKVEYERPEKLTSTELLAELGAEQMEQAVASKNADPIPVKTVLLLIGGMIAIAVPVLIIFLKKRGKKKSENEQESSVEESKKAKLRSMLLDGSITEEEYKELLKKLGGSENVEK